VLAIRFSTERNTNTHTHTHTHTLKQAGEEKWRKKKRHSKDTNKDRYTKEGSRELANDETQTTTTTIH